jgi:hypothetical protein
MATRTVHYDGSDVIVLNERGSRLRDVDEVCIEFDRAIVHVHVPRAKRSVSRTAAALVAFSATEQCVIYSARDGRPYFAGDARVVGV